MNMIGKSKWKETSETKLIKKKVCIWNVKIPSASLSVSMMLLLEIFLWFAKFYRKYYTGCNELICYIFFHKNKKKHR